MILPGGCSPQKAWSSLMPYTGSGVGRIPRRSSSIARWAAGVGPWALAIATSNRKIKPITASHHWRGQGFIVLSLLCSSSLPFRPPRVRLHARVQGTYLLQVKPK